MSWFKTVSANLNTRIKCKALFACREAASAMIAEEWCNMEEQTKVTHGCLDARKVEYCAEVADIRVVRPHGGPTSSKPVDRETGNQQGQLDNLRSNRDFQKHASKHGQGQLEYISKDVSQTGENKRFVKLRNRAETKKPDKQAEKGSKKVLGLQEYQDRWEDKKKAAEVAGSATNPDKVEDWDADVTPLCVLQHLDDKIWFPSSTKILELKPSLILELELQLWKRMLNQMLSGRSQSKMKLVVPFSIILLDQMIWHGMPRFFISKLRMTDSSSNTCSRCSVITSWISGE